jgi:hypothetical protein
MLTAMDAAKSGIQEIVDMPDSLVYLFIRIVHQNAGRLGSNKRHSHFAMLSDQEIEQMETAVRTAFGLDNTLEKH